MVRLLAAMLLAIGGLTVLTAAPAQACSCVGGPPAAGVRNADVIFRGTVVEDRRKDGSHALTFDVDTSWKGEVPDPVVVHTGLGGGDCGLGGGEGGRQLVFANPDEEGVLHTGICSSYGATLSTLERMLGPGVAPAPSTAVDESGPRWTVPATLTWLLAVLGLLTGAHDRH